MNMVKRIIRVLRSCIAWKEADCRKWLTRHSGEHQVNENMETHLGCRQAAGWDWDPHEVMDSWNLRIPINWHHKSQSGRSPGGGHSNPLQYSCLENPMDRGPGGLQSMGSQRLSWTQLKWLSTPAHTPNLDRKLKAACVFTLIVEDAFHVAL